MVAGENASLVAAVAIPAGDHVVKVWLQDEAGNADPAIAAVLTVDPSTITARRAVDTNPPVLDPGPAPSSRLRITRARRSGSTLTIARGATTAISAKVSKGKTTASPAAARTKPRKGRWSLKIKLAPALQRSNAFYVTVTYAGQSSYRKTTLHRRLARKPPPRGSTAEEFSVELRSGRR